jgi:carbon storage regulator CsrA
MLVLTRKAGEVISLVTKAGERIDITLVQMKGSQARIGIVAPAEVAVMRAERLEMLEASGANIKSSQTIRDIQKAYTSGKAAP